MKKSYMIVRQGTKRCFPKKGVDYCKIKHRPTVVFFNKNAAVKELYRLAKEFPNEDFMLYEADFQVTYEIDCIVKRDPTMI